MNGGKCQDGKCICTAPFCGDLCEKGPCSEKPCQNGGQCMGGKCICPAGFNGDLCEFGSCTNVQCFNGGHCQNGKCYCPTGLSGDRCEIGPCTNAPCQNGGKCLNGRCQCPTWCSGDLCERGTPPKTAAEAQSVTGHRRSAQVLSAEAEGPAALAAHESGYSSGFPQVAGMTAGIAILLLTALTVWHFVAKKDAEPDTLYTMEAGRAMNR